jgi:hypothetical protein
VTATDTSTSSIAGTSPGIIVTGAAAVKSPTRHAPQRHDPVAHGSR